MTETKKEKERSLSLANYHLKFLASWLDRPMHGTDARTRHRFLKMIQPRLQEVEDERIKKLESLCEKTPDGKPKMTENKSFDLSPENLTKFTDDMEVLNNEKLVIDYLPSTRETLLAMKVIVKDVIGKVDMNVIEGKAYDEICTAFESM